jgi:hypothetical protein
VAATATAAAAATVVTFIGSVHWPIRHSAVSQSGTESAATANGWHGDQWLPIDVDR